jgi:ribonucleotide reductase beta subunit family protein with ferritin-like domain
MCQFETSKTILEPLIYPPENEPGVDPPAFPEVAEFARKAEQSLWPTTEVDLSTDTKDWETCLNDDQRNTLTCVLGFFRGAESTVLENLVRNLYLQTNLHEAKEFYAYQIGAETVHERMYIMLGEALISDREKRRKMMNAVKNMQCVKDKNEWAKKWTKDNLDSYATLILIYACVEGIMFSSSFAVIYYVRKYLPNKLRGLTSANDLIARDEGLHYRFACFLLRYIILEKLDEKLVHQIVREAVEVEKSFAREALKNNGFPGLRTKSMEEYVEFIGDNLLRDCGYDTIYKTENPLTYMSMVSMQNKTAFFEKRSSDYKKVNMTSNSWDDLNEENF